jgi:hypothetical protein
LVWFFWGKGGYNKYRKSRIGFSISRGEKVMFEQTFKTSMGISTILGGISGDYFNFFCEKCGSRVRVKFLGYETTAPKFESVCRCGEVHRFKAIITDIPNKKIG